jgi:hypothetical protein
LVRIIINTKPEVYKGVGLGEIKNEMEIRKIHWKVSDFFFKYVIVLFDRAVIETFALEEMKVQSEDRYMNRPLQSTIASSVMNRVNKECEFNKIVLNLVLVTSDIYPDARDGRSISKYRWVLKGKREIHSLGTARTVGPDGRNGVQWEQKARRQSGHSNHSVMTTQ